MIHSQPSQSPSSLTFEALGVAAPIVRAAHDAGYTVPTEIQAQAIGPALNGRDILASAQTGTGKTFAFVMPILHRLAAQSAPARARGSVRALVLSPTRELAAQIGRDFERLARHTHASSSVIFGGVSAQPQMRALRDGLDVLVATPGRLEDLLSQRALSLAHVEMFVLDEADRMLDEGFLPAVKRIAAKLPSRRQSMLFSATMPAPIQPLAASLLRDPVRVSVTPVGSTPQRISQGVYLLDRTQKGPLLRSLLGDPTVTRAVVFTRTKRGADKVARDLAANAVAAQAIHGNKSQNARERALESFRNGQLRVLVATDLAARGIDVERISHVINFDLPVDPEAYVHRIGRTGRAGHDGNAVSLCTADEQPTLRKIERLIQHRVPVLQVPVGERRAAAAPRPLRAAQGETTTASLSESLQMAQAEQTMAAHQPSRVAQSERTIVSIPRTPRSFAPRLRRARPHSAPH